MNYLQLCQAVYREGGLSGSISRVQNQQGEALRVTQWVADAWRRLRNDQGITWDFQKPEVIVQLQAGKGEYSFDDLNLARAVDWDTNSMRIGIFEDMRDETFLAHMSYHQFRDFWQFSARRGITGRPLNVSIDPALNLLIAPIPERDYWLAARMQLDPEDLRDDEDVPIGIHPRFHMVLAWDALRQYGMFESAPEVVQRADVMYKTLLQQIWQVHGQEMEMAGALA